jgi:hypothetical protein
MRDGHFDLRTDGQQQAKHVESVPADGAGEAVEKATGRVLLDPDTYWTNTAAGLVQRY